MIPADGIDGIDDLVDLFRGLAVHKPVEFREVGFDGCVVEAARFVIRIVLPRQDVLGIVSL